MQKNKKNEELQSRREFFKKAAKRTLPIIGAAIIASNPMVANAMDEMGGSESGCSTNCSVRCSVVVVAQAALTSSLFTDRLLVMRSLS